MIDATRSTHNQEIIDSYAIGYNQGKLDSKIKFIEKACEWLDVNFPTTDSAGSWYKEGFIKQFKKAME
jgi:hypothetical protein